MTELSPAAQAALDAANRAYDQAATVAQGAAAALRAVADHVEYDWDGFEIVDYLCGLADELERQS